MKSDSQMIAAFPELRLQEMCSLQETYGKISGAHSVLADSPHTFSGRHKWLLKKRLLPKIHNKMNDQLVGTFTDFSCQCFLWSDKLGCENKVWRRKNWRFIIDGYCAAGERPGSGMQEHGGSDLWRGAEMRMPVGSRSEQHLPSWLSGRKAGAQEERWAGKEPNEAEDRRTDCLKEMFWHQRTGRFCVRTLCQFWNTALGKQVKVLKTNPAETWKTQHRRFKSLWQ